MSDDLVVVQHPDKSGARFASVLLNSSNGTTQRNTLDEEGRTAVDEKNARMLELHGFVRVGDKPRDTIDLRNKKPLPKTIEPLNVVMEHPLQDSPPTNIVNFKDGNCRFLDSNGRLAVGATHARELAEAGWKQIGST
jgi:hypothetical protein